MQIVIKVPICESKGWVGILRKSLFVEALELGRWASEEDVTISKQTFRVVLYPLRRPRGPKIS